MARLVGLAGGLLCLAVWAAPAPWYLWRSLTGPAVVCAQFAPGDGWVVESGPFRDSRCTRPVAR